MMSRVHENSRSFAALRMTPSLVFHLFWWAAGPWDTQDDPIFLLHLGFSFDLMGPRKRHYWC